MTDFLSRLAERSRGLTPNVQPVLASRYAPGPAIPDSPSLRVDEIATPPQFLPESTHEPLPESVATSDRIPSDSPPRADEAARTFAPIPPTASERPVAQPPLNVSGRRPTLASQLDSRQSPTSRVVSSAEQSPLKANRDLGFNESGSSFPTESIVIHHTRLAGPPQSKDLERPMDGATMQEPSSQPAQDRIVPRAAALRSRESGAAERSRAPSAPTPVSPSPEATSSESDTVERLVVEPTLRRTDATRPGPSMPADLGERQLPVNESTPTVVRVTIGRIEVRAVAPPTPASVSPRPPSMRASRILSLDDYLKRRGEVQR